MTDAEQRGIDAIAEGLRILSKYDRTGSSVTTEHDQLWAGPEEIGIDGGATLRGDGAIQASPEDVLAPEDSARLLALGWFIDEDIDRWSIRV